MKIRFKVKMSDPEKIRTMAKAKLRRILMKSMFKMEELAILRAPFDRGHLRQNITLFPQVLANRYELLSKASYSEPLEYGNMPTIVKFGDILAWVERKGIRNSSENKYAFAKYVVKKIREEGVNPNPFMRPALQEVKDIWLSAYASEEAK